MDIKLPPKTGDSAQTATLTGARQITVIGANGSGKSRFCDWIMRECADKAYRISALRALLPSAESNCPAGSIGDLFNRINASTTHLTNTANTEFERLTYIMLTDEFRQLMNYKTHLLMRDEQQVPFPKTKLDTTVKMWQEVFPKNKVLRENGRLLFATEGQTDSYSALRLSDGEKAVLYYIGAVLYAMPQAVVLVDDPEVFMNHSMARTLWNVIEEMRPDCTFIYNTHDVDFAATRIDNKCIWVKSYDPAEASWDYEVMATSNDLGDALYYDLLGSRKPVLFVEGDAVHSIDSRLYPLIFPDYTVKPLGSCDKVIETVRSFGDLKAFHHLDSRGIVDRDRRTDEEVQYLRKKNIMVPNVAEIENILMLEGVIRAVAQHCRKDDGAVVRKVKHAVLAMFSQQLRQQALMHVRHRVKHMAEVRIDMRFRNIAQLEDHLSDLVNEINPRGIYETLCREFHQYEQEADYAQVLRVFNQKTMLSESNVAGLCGLCGKDSYIRAVLSILKSGGPHATMIRTTIKQCFGFAD